MRLILKLVSMAAAAGFGCVGCAEAEDYTPKSLTIPPDHFVDNIRVAPGATGVSAIAAGSFGVYANDGDFLHWHPIVVDGTGYFSGKVLAGTPEKFMLIRQTKGAKEGEQELVLYTKGQEPQTLQQVDRNTRPAFFSTEIGGYGDGKEPMHPYQMKTDLMLTFDGGKHWTRYPKVQMLDNEIILMRWVSESTLLIGNSSGLVSSLAFNKNHEMTERWRTKLRDGVANCDVDEQKGLAWFGTSTITALTLADGDAAFHITTQMHTANHLKVTGGRLYVYDHQAVEAWNVEGQMPAMAQSFNLEDLRSVQAGAQKSGALIFAHGEAMEWDGVGTALKPTPLVVDNTLIVPAVAAAREQAVADAPTKAQMNEMIALATRLGMEGVPIVEALQTDPAFNKMTPRERTQTMIEAYKARLSGKPLAGVAAKGRAAGTAPAGMLGENRFLRVLADLRFIAPSYGIAVGSDAMYVSEKEPLTWKAVVAFPAPAFGEVAGGDARGAYLLFRGPGVTKEMVRLSKYSAEKGLVTVKEIPDVPCEFVSSAVGGYVKENKLVITVDGGGHWVESAVLLPNARITALHWLSTHEVIVGGTNFDVALFDMKADGTLERRWLKGLNSSSSGFVYDAGRREIWVRGTAMVALKTENGNEVGRIDKGMTIDGAGIEGELMYVWGSFGVEAWKIHGSYMKAAKHLTANVKALIGPSANGEGAVFVLDSGSVLAWDGKADGLVPAELRVDNTLLGKGAAAVSDKNAAEPSVAEEAALQDLGKRLAPAVRVQLEMEVGELGEKHAMTRREKVLWLLEHGKKALGE